MPSGGISVSPDGKIIAFSGNYQDIKDSVIQKKLEGLHIMTIPIEGGEPTQLTTNPASDGYPVWSPDGTTIAFIRRDNNKTPLRNIYTISAGGGTPEKVTTKDDMVTYGRIDWSPDGKLIGFFAADNTIRTIPAEGGKSRIVVSDIGIHPHFGLSFSKDGDKMVYSHNERIHVIDLDGGNTAVVETGIEAIHTMPSWSPDGGKIAFSAYHRGETNLWFMENFLSLENLHQKPEAKFAEEPEGIRIRQIWKQPYLDFLGSVSADGRLLSYVHWGEGDVAVRNLFTGEDQVLTHEADLDDSPQHFAQSPKISKNGRQIAYFWWNPYHTFDLQLIDVNNQSSHLIYKEEGVEVYPATWLSDHELITIRQNRNTENTAISSFNVSNGTYRDLKKFEGRTWAQIATSPDEKFIAYDFEDKKSDGNFDINLLPVDGGDEIVLVSHPANDKVLGWDPTKDVFLFISDRSGDWDLWALPVHEGNPGGPAKRLYTGIGEVEPMGFRENGDCYFGFSRRNFDASLAPFNSGTGEIQEESGISLEGSNFWLTWSPDGQYLTYVKEDSNSNTPWQLTIKDVKTGEERGLGNNLLVA
jgi:Tol biopolymer transport system component